MGDVGALVIGSKLGKHPLLPAVSPNKSIEGCVGGLCFSIVTALLCRHFLPEFPQFAWMHIAAMGAFFGALGQIGDLSELMIKRDCNVKDSGKFLPGLGGVLDLIDSLLFSAPAFYLYISSVLSVAAM